MLLRGGKVTMTVGKVTMSPVKVTMTDEKLTISLNNEPWTSEVPRVKIYKIPLNLQYGIL